MKIKVLAKVFDVLDATKLTDPGGSDDIVLGEVDHAQETICLETNQSQRNRDITLLHEITHAIFEQLGFRKECDNEHLVSALSIALYMLLTENDFNFLKR